MISSNGTFEIVRPPASSTSGSWIAGSSPASQSSDSKNQFFVYLLVVGSKFVSHSAMRSNGTKNNTTITRRLSCESRMCCQECTLNSRCLRTFAYAFTLKKGLKRQVSASIVYQQSERAYSKGAMRKISTILNGAG